MQLEINIESVEKCGSNYAHELEPMTVFHGSDTKDIGMRTAERGILWLTGPKRGVIESSSFVWATPVRLAKLEIEL